MNKFLAEGEPKKYIAANHKEWLNLRKGIGSSEVATILGVNRWQTPYQLWLAKRSDEVKEEENFLMKMGHKLEPIIAECWSEETGKKIIEGTEEEYVYVHPQKDFLRVSPDREFIGDNGRGILECKSTQLAIEADDLPPYWFCQVQYQLGVSQLEYANIAWLRQGREFGYAGIVFNEEFFKYMVEKVSDFWNRNVIGGEEPELESVEDIALKYTRSMDKPYEAGQSLMECYNRLKTISEKKKQIEEDEKQLKEQIKLAMQDCDRLTYKGETLATWKSAKDSVEFDMKRFKAENPEIFAKYAISKAGSRRFIIK